MSLDNAVQALKDGHSRVRSTSLRLPPATVPVTMQEQTKGFWKANDVAYEMISVRSNTKSNLMMAFAKTH